MVGHATDNLVMHMDDYSAAAHKAAAAYASKQKGGSRDAGSSKRRRVGDGVNIPNSEKDRDDANGLDDSDLMGAQNDTEDTGQQNQGSPAIADIIDRFLHGVLPEHPSVSASSSLLEKSLAAAREGLEDDGLQNGSRRSPLRQLSSSEAKHAIEVLDNAGLLIRRDGKFILILHIFGHVHPLAALCQRCRIRWSVCRADAVLAY